MKDTYVQLFEKTRPRLRRCWRSTKLPAESSSRAPARISATIRFATSRRVQAGWRYLHVHDLQSRETPVLPGSWLVTWLKTRTNAFD
jgi:hypothetical protein